MLLVIGVMLATVIYRLAGSPNTTGTREHIVTVLYNFERHQREIIAPSANLSCVDVDEYRSMGL